MEEGGGGSEGFLSGGWSAARRQTRAASPLLPPSGPGAPAQRLHRSPTRHCRVDPEAGGSQGRGMPAEGRTLALTLHLERTFSLVVTVLGGPL